MSELNVGPSQPMTCAPVNDEWVPTPMSIVSKVVTVLFHPLLMPLYCSLIYLFGLKPYRIGTEAFEIAVVGAVTCLCPLAILGVLMAFGVLRKLEMPTAEERIVPLFSICFALTVANFFIAQNNLLSPLVTDLILGEAIMLSVATAITLKWKVSLHTLGAGGFLAFVYVAGCVSFCDFVIYAALSFVGAGLSAWTRLYERAHTPAQLFVGFVLGAVLMALSLCHFGLH